ncbi:MAG: VWA domain-containing protein [Acidobacteria bacterium]|nr:VWA domain-containing protein [Acidobacteriota bacterium]
MLYERIGISTQPASEAWKLPAWVKSSKLSAVSMSCDLHGWDLAMSRRRPRKLAQSSICLVWLLCLLTSPLVAQRQTPPETHASTLKVDVALVTLNFSIRDNARRTVGTVQKEDIAIYEDEVSQVVTFFDMEPAPLSLIVLLDVSESVRAFSGQIRAASRVLPDLLREGDEVAVIAFSDLPNLFQEFTGDPRKIRSALQRAATGFFGATNVNDSLYLAARKLTAQTGKQRRAILLVSDGKGNRGERERAFEQLKDCGATLLALSIGVPSKLARGPLLLTRWIRETGGQLLFFSSENELKTNLRAALDSVRCQYSAAYVPTNRRRDGSFRRLKVELALESPLASRPVVIQGPDGYFAHLESSQQR